MKRLGILCVALCIPGTAFAWFFFTGGPVLDLGKLSRLQLQYAADQNKLNLLNAQDQSSRDQFIAIMAMNTAYGDGSGVETYVPGGVLTVNADQRKAIDDYIRSLPSTPQGQSVAAHLRRTQQREAVIAAYSARLKETAAAQQRGALGLAEISAIENELKSQGMDARLAAIEAQAGANRLKAAMRERQRQILEYRASRNALENALKK